ncbi:wiskott-Aldrich syndrome protein family member 2-like isoform X1 [Cotesia glomerata]|uniref:wiskott-Aldrich syndrome protein family member 2-like isoform X1 n=1 Tax=Cotesia glomerata TaxID=32391 RepID=UPI001D0144AD|nr:wiskott-Aldrich syndrome protein family member 2-like isoform X1 [Cotesia glomerata]
MGKIPDRWLDYKPCGVAIKGTRIVAFKVPLADKISRYLPEHQQFTPEVLLKALPNLKYIIDLTNTTRYYDKQELLKLGLIYKKVPVEGKRIPIQQDVLKFFRAMEQFTKDAKDDELIGVHCTHGLNRTGYLVCRFLIQQQGWDITEAITAFEDARGHSIERENYVLDLKACRHKKINTSEDLLDVIRKDSKHSKRNYNSRDLNWRNHEPPSVPVFAERHREEPRRANLYSWRNPSLSLRSLEPRPYDLLKNETNHPTNYRNPYEPLFHGYREIDGPRLDPGYGSSSRSGPGYGPSPRPEPGYGPSPRPEPGYRPSPRPEPGYGPSPRPEPGYGPRSGPDYVPNPQPDPGYGPSLRPDPGYGPSLRPEPGYAPKTSSRRDLYVPTAVLRARRNLLAPRNPTLIPDYVRPDRPMMPPVSSSVPLIPRERSREFPVPPPIPEKWRTQAPDRTDEFSERRSGRRRKFDDTLNNRPGDNINCSVPLAMHQKRQRSRFEN